MAHATDDALYDRAALTPVPVAQPDRLNPTVGHPPRR